MTEVELLKDGGWRVINEDRDSGSDDEYRLAGDRDDDGSRPFAAHSSRAASHADNDVIVLESDDDDDGNVTFLNFINSLNDF